MPDKGNNQVSRGHFRLIFVPQPLLTTSAEISPLAELFEARDVLQNFEILVYFKTYGLTVFWVFYAS